MPKACPECGADQPLDAMRCDVCGTDLMPGTAPSTQIAGEDVVSYSLYVIGLILLAIAIPCLIGLLCFLLSR